MRHLPLSCRKPAAVVLLLLLLVVTPGWTEPNLPEEFGRISFTEGLINSSVSSITQDEEGFLWFGTQAGVQRYDGYGMRLYTAEPFEAGSLSNQLVQTISLGRDSSLWIGTYGGLNHLDFLTGRIVSYPHEPGNETTLSNNVVTSITYDSEDTLWVATLDGLNRLDSRSEGRFTRFTPDPEDPRALPHRTIRSVFRDSRDRLWVGSHGGLSLLAVEEEGSPLFRTWSDEGPRNESLPSPYVMTIAEDQSGYLWIGTWDGGVSRFDPESGMFVHFELADHRLYTLMVARTGLVYAGTWGGGLFVLDPLEGVVAAYRHDPSLSGGLAHDVVYSLYEDRSGIIWIGTNGNGINTFDRSRASFRYIHRDLPRERRLDSGKVQVLWHDPAGGDLYVGLQNSGLNVVDGATGTVTRYRHDPADPRSISNDTINAIHPEREGTILVATHGGINRFFPPRDAGETGRFELLETPAIPDPIVYRLLRDSRDRLWIGTYSAGVFRYDGEGRVHQYSHDPSDERTIGNNLIYEILEDRYGEIWVATNGGLHRYNAAADDFDRFIYDPENRAGISGLSVGNIYEDSAGTLWVGTRSGGLNRFDRETETFRHFTIREGLSSNSVVALGEGERGRLYVATPNGLNVVTADGAVTRIDERDGLSVREFSTGIARDAAGALLLGAFSEVVRVAPLPEVEQEVPPTTVITGMKVLNRPLEIPLEYSGAPVVELAHTENFLEFSFAALSFSLPERNTYRYRLEGFDGAWVDAGTRNTATYTNVPPGRYQFLVVGTDARNNAGPEPARVLITIRPPFWRTTWFVALMTVLLILVVGAVYALRVRSLRRINSLLEQTVAERTASLREANEVKERFFSIIAHDLRGPVTGLESLSRQARDDHGTYSPELLGEVFSTIHAGASAMQGMLENLLEWARVQSGGLESKAQTLALEPLLRDVAGAHSVAVHAKNITLHVECEEGITLRADPDMTRVVVQNLLNNAIKYTPTGGEVYLSGGRTPESGAVEIVVRDSGIGIAPDKLDTLFRVDMRHRTVGTAGERGSGFGLSLCKDLMRLQGGELHLSSEVGSGTTVTVRFAP